jgi:hypothetical protein
MGEGPLVGDSSEPGAKLDALVAGGMIEWICLMAGARIVR